MQPTQVFSPNATTFLTGAASSVPRRACARNAGNGRPRPSDNCASRAARRPIEPAAPATPGSGRPGCRAETHGRPASSSTRPPNESDTAEDLMGEAERVRIRIWGGLEAMNATIKSQREIESGC